MYLKLPDSSEPGLRLEPDPVQGKLDSSASWTRSVNTADFQIYQKKNFTVEI